MDINKKIEMIKRNKTGIPDLKCTISEMKNPLEVSTADLSRRRKESRIGQMKLSSLRTEEKNMRKNEQSLRDL